MPFTPIKQVGTTDEHGRFTVRPEDGRVILWINGFLELRKEPGRPNLRVAATPRPTDDVLCARLDADGFAVTEDITMLPGAVLRGSLKALSGVITHITLTYPVVTDGTAGNDTHFPTHAVVDPDGAFEISGLTPGAEIVLKATCRDSSHYVRIDSYVLQAEQAMTIEEQFDCDAS